MKIVHAASEMFPLVKTGGLADAVGALTKALAGFGHEVAVFLPGYRTVLEHPMFAKAAKHLMVQVELGDEFLQADVYRLSLGKRLTLYVIRRDEFYDRSHPYGCEGRDYDDNDRRFIYFCKAVVEVLRVIDFKADVVHCHDWQTGLLPALLRMEEGKLRDTLALKTVVTIHNIAFQGIFPKKSFSLANLPEDLMGIDGIEFYGQINMLKGGILFADNVTTVSPNYCEEIQTPKFGCGLEGVIQTRADDLAGFINGVDTDVWSPKTDPLLPENYSAMSLRGKEACRRNLLGKNGFSADYEGPIYGMVCRLAEQKGIDLLLSVREFFIKGDCRLIILGSGDTKYEDALRKLVEAHPEKISLSTALDEEASHLIESGSDFFLMPSIFEPCGLNQMYSQLYGTIPLVSRVGGLVDTVIDLEKEPANGTGIMFAPKTKNFLKALRASHKLFQDKAQMGKVIKAGMKRDFSWKKAAKAYEGLYQDVI